MIHTAGKWTSFFVLFLLCCASYGSTPDKEALSVCEVLSHPAKYVGQNVTLRGEVLFVPPHIPLQLLGLCGGGIDVILPDSHDVFVDDALFKKFRQDIWTYRKSAMVAQLTGALKPNHSGIGTSLQLYLTAVKGVRLAPEISLVGATLPVFGQFAKLPAKSEATSLLITVTNGVVTDAQVEEHTGDSLEQLALENVKTWKFAFFQSGTFTARFSYRVVKATTLPVPVNPTVEMNLPSNVVITRFTR